MYADRGATPTSGPPFDHYDAKPGTMFSTADEILGKGKKVEGVGDDVKTAQRPASAASHGFILPKIKGAPKPVQQKTQKVNQTTVFASGCVKYWGKGIQTFNSGVDKLNDEWDAAVADDFGLTKPTKPSTSGTPMPGNVRATETYNADLAAFNTQLSAKKASKAKELRGRFTKLETKLDNLAQKIAGMLKKGPDDEKSVITLFSAGALPIQAPMFFPRFDFGKADWRKALEEYAKQFPGGRLPKLTKDEVKALLEQNPELTQAVNWLLKKNGIELTAFERDLVKVQAAADVWVLKDHIGDIHGATYRLQIINGTAQGDGRINEAGTLFIDSWLDTIGPDALTDLPDVYDADELKPIANAIMLRTNPEQLEGPASDEPPATTIQTLLESRIGTASSTGRTADADGDGQIDGLERFTGWSELLSASDVTGGDAFSEALGRQAVQARQDMNASLVGTRIDGHGYVPSEFKSLLEDDSASSDLLSVTARNEDASSRLLVDDDVRPLLLGLNWNDGDGAADVIHAGTDRNPDEGGGTYLQAKAAYEVMQEIADDQGEYHRRIDNEAVSDAIVDVGVTWVDTFAEKPGGDDGPGAYENWKDPLGRTTDFGISLSDEDRQSFLEFLSGSGDRDATRFHAAATTYTNDLVDDAIESGKTEKIGDAVFASGLLEGRVKRADVEFFEDTAEDAEDKRQAAWEAEVRSKNAQAAALKVASSVAATAGGVAFPPAAPFLSIGNAAAVPVIDELVADAGDPPPAESEDQAATLERQVDQMSEQTSSRLIEIEHRHELSPLERETFLNTWDRGYDNAFDKRGGDNDQESGWADPDEARRRLYGDAADAIQHGGDRNLPNRPGGRP